MYCCGCCRRPADYGIAAHKLPGYSPQTVQIRYCTIAVTQLQVMLDPYLALQTTSQQGSQLASRCAPAFIG